MANQSKLSGNKENNRTREEPPIPLKAVKKEYKKEDCVVIKCWSNPSKATSTTYDLLIPMFKTGNPKEWLKWVKNVKRAAKGQNMTTGPTKFALAKRLLDSGALLRSKTQLLRLRQKLMRPLSRSSRL